MRRYQIELQYDGTNYAGWQKQPNAPTIQQEIENALSLISGESIQITGCGRTDAGVHASRYFAHTDLLQPPADNIVYRLNHVLPDQISIIKIKEVNKTWHARFDAVRRSYRYDIHFQKDPFKRHFSFYYPRILKADFSILQESARCIGSYKEFQPFCKTKSQVSSHVCEIAESHWVLKEDEGIYSYHISANRFLRGMVRLIVGMCLESAFGKISLREIRQSLENQERLSKSWSVPASGLHLTEVFYVLPEGLPID